MNVATPNNGHGDNTEPPDIGSAFHMDSIAVTSQSQTQISSDKQLDQSSLPLSRSIHQTRSQTHQILSSQHTPQSNSPSQAQLSITQPQSPTNFGSDVILPQSRRESHSSSSSSRKVLWTDEKDALLVESLVQEITKGNRPNNIYKKQAWVNITQAANKTGRHATDKQVKNRFSELKKQFMAWLKLVKNPNFHWDDQACRFNAPSSTWEAYIPKNPDASRFKSGTHPLVPRLIPVFEIYLDSPPPQLASTHRPSDIPVSVVGNVSDFSFEKIMEDEFSMGSGITNPGRHIIPQQVSQVSKRPRISGSDSRLIRTNTNTNANAITYGSEVYAEPQAPVRLNAATTSTTTQAEGYVRRSQPQLQGVSNTQQQLTTSLTSSSNSDELLIDFIRTLERLYNKGLIDWDMLYNFCLIRTDIKYTLSIIAKGLRDDLLSRFLKTWYAKHSTGPPSNS